MICSRNRVPGPGSKIYYLVSNLGIIGGCFCTEYWWHWWKSLFWWPMWWSSVLRRFSTLTIFVDIRYIKHIMHVLYEMQLCETTMLPLGQALISIKYLVIYEAARLCSDIKNLLSQAAILVSEFFVFILQRWLTEQRSQCPHCRYVPVFTRCFVKTAILIVH